MTTLDAGKVRDKFEVKGPAMAAEAKGFPEIPGFDRHWHLAKDDHEIAVTEMEYSLIRVLEAFGRWQRECLAAVSGDYVGGGDVATLHVIRMNDRPKSIKEIGRLMNRDDISNIQYSIRKLVKAGLIEKVSRSRSRKGVTYQTTTEGTEITEQYAILRSSVLLDFTRSVDRMDERMMRASRTLDLMTGAYEQAARTVATHPQKFDE